jgi:hypothetical protein
VTAEVVKLRRGSAALPAAPVPAPPVAAR